MNSLVKVKIYDTIKNTGKATLFLLKYEKQVWLPNVLYRKAKQGNYILVSKKIAEEKGFEYTDFIHTPEAMEVVKNQEAMDDLKYE